MNKDTETSQAGPTTLKPQADAPQETAQGTNEEMEKLKEENTRLTDQLLRAAAELENARKRFSKETEETARYGITKFARDLIDVLENLHRAEASIQNLEELEGNQTLKQVFSGVELTKKSLVDAFDKHGIKRLEPKVGDAFNHDYHQAITQMPATSHPTGSIVQVIQAGYVIHERLLRPALVAVAK